MAFKPHLQSKPRLFDYPTSYISGHLRVTEWPILLFAVFFLCHMQSNIASQAIGQSCRTIIIQYFFHSSEQPYIIIMFCVLLENPTLFHTCRCFLISDTTMLIQLYKIKIMGRGSRPICRVGPKTPQNKMAASVG